VLVNHDFTPNNLIFSHCGGRRENFWGISFEKSRFCAKKIIFFPILGGARTPPLLDLPLYSGHLIVWRKIVIYQHATSTIYPNISRTQIQHDNQPLNVCGNNQYFTFYINRTSVALFTKIRNYSPNFFVLWK
jgi:hypothetical protein